MRVLVGGAWGFACDRRLTREGARDAALRARAIRARGRRSRAARARAASSRATGSYRTPVERDPFSVSLDEKVELCLRAEEALRTPEVKVREAFVRAQRERKVLVSSDGADVEQELVECGGGIDAIAVGDGALQIRAATRARTAARARRRGWEYVEGLGLERRGAARRRAGGGAAARRRVPAGRDDGRDRRRADAAPGARVGRPPDRARPRLRHRGRLRGHELPQAGRPRLAALRLGAA